MKDHGKKIEYRCSNCGDIIPYGSESAIQREYDDIFCSQECLWDWYGFKKFDWSSHLEYERTKEELEEIHRKEIEFRKKWKQEEAERKAYNEAHKHECKEVEQDIKNLLNEQRHDNLNIRQRKEAGGDNPSNSSLD